MITLPQKIKTKWNSKHKKYYESKNYVYTKMNDEFEVDVLDLPLSSQLMVNAKCDYCNKELEVAYFRANVNMKVSCKHCRPKRTKELYGYSSNWELKKTKESIKKTFIGKYGVDHNFKVKEVQEKRKQTFLKKYGVDNPYKNKDIINVNSAKRLQTLYKNGNTPCSNQQKHIFNLVGGKLNYPVSRCMLDIAFPEEMIYIEYDGGGHNLSVKKGSITQQEFDVKQIRRQRYLKSLGWKLIRIICNSDKLPEDNVIVNDINKCILELEHKSWIEIIY
jgi:very-short-patch-repair endonuclease